MKNKLSIIGLVLFLIGATLAGLGYSKKQESEDIYKDWEYAQQEFEAYQNSTKDLDRPGLRASTSSSLQSNTHKRLMEFTEANEFWRGQLYGGLAAIVIGLVLILIGIKRSKKQISS